jgi:hypothetical protein
MRTRHRRALIAGLVFAACAHGVAQAPAGRTAVIQTGEAATARRFASLKHDPLRLYAFLKEMPKGGDLHSHLSGAVYAENYLAWAAADGLCVVTATMTIVRGPCDDKAGTPPASALLQNLPLFAQAIDAMSMRHWDPARNGHDHFFETFRKFGPASQKTGDMLADVTSRAAAERVSYLELMVTPDGGAAVALGATISAETDLARWRNRLLAAGLREKVLSAAKQRLDTAEARQKELLRCGTPKADAGCGVTIRYIAQIARAAPPTSVFAQMVGWFELASSDPRVVSLNLVQPEDDPTAVRDFTLHMTMLDFLHRQYPDIPIALHAGELVNGLVPPEVLRSHIRDSVTNGHARRIGHATSVMNEDDPYGLLREMAERKILVEITLSSSDQILGVKGAQHPLRLFLEYGVPVAIATDDPGVARSSHTLEFVNAVEEHDLDYPTIKRMVRNSIDYAFADSATKTRLKSDLERSFTAFERMPH